ncbi:hypothetical protein L6R53_14000 [Myxococcota bacterium]|nr:hypothetical protein [Myxococcota bacterium]
MGFKLRINIGKALKDVGEAVGDVVQGVGDAVSDVAQGVGNVAEDVVQGVGQAGDRVLDTVDNTVDGVLGLANTVVTEGSEIVQGGQKVVGQVAGTALREAGSTIRAVGPQLAPYALAGMTGGASLAGTLLGGLGSQQGTAPTTTPTTTSSSSSLPEWALPVGIGVAGLVVVGLLTSQPQGKGRDR